MEEKNLISKIKEIIKTKVRPMLVMDGGNIEFVSFENNVLSVKLLGACHGCPLSSLTLKHSVEGLINDELSNELKQPLTVQAIDFEEDGDSL